MSIKILGASRLLKANIDSGSPVEFTIGPTVRVSGSHGMMLGAMGSGGMMRNGNWTTTATTIGNVQDEDFVWFSGYNDPASSSFVITQIMVWVN